MVHQEQVLYSRPFKELSVTKFTGKTMTANAVANYLGKKLLLVTVSLLTESQITKVLGIPN